MPWTTPETFTAGQTLTAASMNILSGNDLALYARDGLVLITSSTLTAATTLNVSGCFSATYRNYIIVSSGGLATAATGGEIRMKMRSGSTDNSDAQYNFLGYKSASASLVNLVGGASNAGFLVGYGAYNTANSRWGNFTATVYDPFSTDWTHYTATGNGVDSGGSEASATASGSHRVAASFDGFTLIHPVSTTTTVRVYGYNL